MLQRVWNGVLTMAKRIGRVQAWLILTVFYFVILAPAALIYRLAADPLRLRPARSIWRDRPTPSDPLAWAKAQS